MEPTKADNEVEEEHLINFVVNSLNDELVINLGEDVEVTTETLHEVLAGASAGGTSINHVCETTNDSPHANTVRGHLTEQFELDSVEAVATPPDRPLEVCADLHLHPYDGDEEIVEYGDEDDPAILCTDQYTISDGIDESDEIDDHLAIDHDEHYVVVDAHTNSCENRHNFLRDWLGRFRGVPKHYLQGYLNFFSLTLNTDHWFEEIINSYIYV